MLLKIETKLSPMLKRVESYHLNSLIVVQNDLGFVVLRKTIMFGKKMDCFTPLDNQKFELPPRKVLIVAKTNYS